MAARVTEDPLDPGPELRDSRDPRSGAVVVLTAARGEGGGERPGGDAGPAEGPDDPPGGDPLEALLEALEAEARDRFAIRRCRLRWRTGAPEGEAEALAVVRAPHRKDAFDAARWALAELRDRRP